jgi:type II secretory pathway pseudopilin PulG
MADSHLMGRANRVLHLLTRRVGTWSRVRARGLVRSGDSGFTLVELMVATGVIVTALTLVSGVITNGVVQTGVARQRQSADGLANQVLEQIRSLPFKNVQAGLKSTDTSGDSNIVSTGCPTAPCFGGERVVASAGLANLDPLVPHRKTLTVGPTTYTVSSYVTYYENNLTRNTYRVTVYVTWPSNATGQTSKVQAQTIVFSPSSCLSTTTHPFSGPCNPAFSSHAVSDAPNISISGSVAGITLDHLQLWGGSAASDMLVEQITRVDGGAQAGGAALQALGGTEYVVGRQVAHSKADNDPGTSVQQTYSNASSSPAATSQSVGGLTISASGGNALSTTSTTSATSSANLCPRLTGFTNENDSQACGGSSSTQGATVSAAAALNVLGATTLATISPQVTPISAITDQHKGPGSGTPGTGTCPTTPSTGDGCVRSYLNRAAADIGVAGLGVLGPLGFSQYVRVAGLVDQVKAEAGPGTNAPTATQSAGTIQYWNGLGYTSVSIPSLVAAITIPTLSINAPLLGTEITLAGSIKPPSKSTTTDTVTTAQNPACLTPPGTCRTSATAKSVGPTIDVSMTVKVLGATIVDLQISVYTGTGQATATYTPTPLS